MGILPNKELNDVMARNSDVLFFYRLHPSQNSIENVNKLKDFFACRKNVEFEDSTNKPLPLILGIVDLHITGFSS
ncbi:hypothetical protein N9V89_02525, partial [Pseudoalteromonas sp.]|nr:hypothetical protein [Pseudoalteromonas sp.]